MIEEITLGAKLLGLLKRAWPYIAVALAVAAAIGFAVHAHSKAIQRVHDAAFQDGVNAEKAATAAAQRQANARAAKINSDIRKNADETDNRIARAADDQRLRGPGKAVCPRLAPAPGAASGHVAPAGAADAAVAPLRDDERADLIALPFSVLIDFAEQHDRLLNEARSWRESDQRQRAAGSEPAAPQPQE